MRESSREDAARIAVRVCAIKKSAQARRITQEKLLAEAARKRQEIQAQTLEAAGYVLVLSTLKPQIGAQAILNLYRGRWQIELAFKRLKSLIGVGHLKKIDPGGAASWLQGKLMVAFLIETMLEAAERLSPWGYPPGIPSTLPRSRWRETSLMQHLLSKALSPDALTLSGCLYQWSAIARQLAEPPRKRSMQMLQWVSD